MTAQIIDLTNLSAAEGFIIQGDTDGDQLLAVSNAGDVNGDGIDDVIVGARQGDDGGTDAGEAYVIFGRTTGFGTAIGGRRVIDLTSLSASDGFIIQGDTAGDRAGQSVSAAGDVNSDGIADLLVGANTGGDGGSQAGETYVIFGRTTGFGSSVGGRQVIDLTFLSASDGFIVQGDRLGDLSGGRVSHAGDVNGDNIDDFIIGAQGAASTSGEAYVIFGRAGGFGSAVNGRQVLDLTTLSASDGFIIRGDVSGDQFGVTVSNAGDVNADGFDDVIVSANLGDDGGTNAGEAYIIFGRSTGFGSAIGGRQVIDVTNLSTSDGFIIQGDAADDRVNRISTLGDINGDGIDDFIVGATGAGNAGETYVIFGRTTGFGSTVNGRNVIDLTTLSPSDGFVIQGETAGDATGIVSEAGDINGDGINDILVSSFVGDRAGTDAGQSYVIFGRTTGYGTNVGGRQVVSLANLGLTDGLVILGDAAGDGAGGISAAGDVNGDGIDDLMIGAPNGDDGGADAGEVYVIFGNRNFGRAPAIEGTGGNDTLTGLAGDDTINGGAGDDVLVGGTGSDTMNGGTGNDIFVVTDAGDVVTELAGEGRSDRVETNLASYTLPANVEILEYFGAGAFTGTGNAEANIMVAGSLDDVLSGGDGDDTLAGEAGNDTLNGGNGADRLFGGTGADIMNGEAGNDRMTVDNIGDVANGGEGIDTVEISASLVGYTVAADVEIVRNTSGGNLTVTLNSLANTYGGSDGVDFVGGGAGNDSIYGRGGNDQMFGEDGDDFLFGEAGGDSLQGGNGADRIYGGADNDVLLGDAGNDTLYGEAGFDQIFGGAGFDIINGGAGADIFGFNLGDSGNSRATADRVQDFSQAQGDRFQISQGRSFIGTDAFSGTAGEMRYTQAGGNTFIEIDVDGNGVLDEIIRIDGLVDLTGADFLLR